MSIRNLSNSAVARRASPPLEARVSPPLEDAVIASWRDALAAANAQELVAWALDRWQQRLALCTAFQAEGVVLLDMAWRIDRAIRVVTVDTGRLPQETHDLIEKVRWRYGIQVEVKTPDAAAVDAMVASQGPNLFYSSVEGRRKCCRVRKLEPLERALSSLDAWMTGLRREQAASRAGIERIELDAVHGGIVKLNPLADWTTDQVDAYIEEHSVPYNALYDQGYTSIGCAPCTRAVGIGEDPRAGRWWWESEDEPKECGLHWPTDGPSPREVRS